MTRPARGRRRRAALLVASPIAAIILVFGALTAALAFNGSLHPDCLTGKVCYYANVNRAPIGGTYDVLNIGGINVDWSHINDKTRNPAICGGIVTFTWNDCASSAWAHGTTAIEYAWTDHNCMGSSKPIHPGDVIDAFNSPFDNGISSDQDGNSGSNCTIP